VYDELYEKSKQLMRRQRVVLTPEQREFAVRAFVDALLERAVEVIAFCVGAKHCHGLLRFRDPVKHRGQNRDANRLIGQAKGKSAREMSRAGIAPQGGIWAVKCRVRPVKDRNHQLNIAKYIPAHARKGAAVIFLPTRDDSPAKPGASAPRSSPTNSNPRSAIPPIPRNAPKR
jgi:REP element-mobilizing transposase RayT